MTQSTDEAREKRLRKKVQKLGYALKKKRSRTPGHPGYGKFMIVDETINGAVAGHEPFPYSMDLDQVESWLEQSERR
jgi:G:T-mismatch repair DNA endonuclease (very short patch repair protein)